MGEVRVPVAAKWQAQTQRAVENFPISGTTVEPSLISALAAIKGAAALENARLKIVDRKVAEAINAAAREVAAGRMGRRIPHRRVPDRLGDLHQHEHERGPGHPGRPNGSGAKVHPNDDVNASQSSNDVFPSAIHVAAATEIRYRPGSRPGAPGESAAPKSRRIQVGGQVRSYPPDGRHAGDPRPGVRGLRLGGEHGIDASRPACRGWPSFLSGGPRSALASTRPVRSPPEL